jgi:hypothetical protein
MDSELSKMISLSEKNVCFILICMHFDYNKLVRKNKIRHSTGDQSRILDAQENRKNITTKP